jgi:hypothetical protein
MSSAPEVAVRTLENEQSEVHNVIDIIEARTGAILATLGLVPDGSDLRNTPEPEETPLLKRISRAQAASRRLRAVVSNLESIDSELGHL